MPEISRVYGIVIRMYHADHNPPHFHATYGASEAVISVDPPALLAGSLPPRALGLVMEWAELHREDRFANWLRARRAEPLASIEGLR